MSSNLVVMPKVDWQAILDSVRAQTRTSTPIKSGELAAIIDAFKAVGDQFEAVASGSFTMASTVQTQGGLEIEHGLGVTPNFFVLFADEIKISDGIAYRDVNYEAAAYMAEGAVGICGVIFVGTGYNDITTADTYHLIRNDSGSQDQTLYRINTFMTAEKIMPYASGSHQFEAGRTFHWLCGATKNR